MLISVLSGNFNSCVVNTHTMACKPLKTFAPKCVYFGTAATEAHKSNPQGYFAPPSDAKAALGPRMCYCHIVSVIILMETFMKTFKKHLIYKYMCY